MERENSGVNTVLIVIVLLLLVAGGVWWFGNMGTPARDTTDNVNVDVNLPTGDTVGGGGEENQ